MHGPQEEEAPADRSVNQAEPGTLHSLIRLAREGLHLLAVAGISWVVKLGISLTGQQHEWWAQILSQVSSLYAVIYFVVVFGAELYAACMHAIRSAVERTKR